MANAYVDLPTPTSGGKYRLTVYGSIQSVDMQNRTGTVKVYATLYSTTAAFSQTNAITLNISAGGVTLGSENVSRCGDCDGYYYGTYTTYSYTSTHNFDSNGNLSVRVGVENVKNTSLIYAPVGGYISTLLEFDNIGPSAIIPTCTLTPIEIDSGGFEGFPIAGYSELKTSVTTTNAVGVSSWYTAPGKQKTLIKENQWINTGSIPSSPDDYEIIIYAYSISSTKNISNTVSVSANVKGYSLPNISSSTSAYRCAADGTPSAQGAYGKLHLEWEVTSIGSNALNSIPIVKVNNTTIQATSGSINDGYFDYIFSLSTSTTGNIEITLNDKIDSNVITSLSVSKANMPLSLFDDGTDIGVSFGEMATQKGYNFYTNNGQWPVTIDGLPISGSGRKIFISTTAVVPQGMAEGDILVVYNQ